MKAFLYLSILALSMAACSTETNKQPKEKIGYNFDFETLNIQQIQKDLDEKKYSIETLIQAHLDRIKALDKNPNGPQLNAVIAVNPDALSIARTLDKELDNGKKRGPLHGIPVLLKDNINTNDSMATTAGSMVLANNFANADAPIVAQLRAAGAIILGKANLSEWANFHSSYSSSGWSALGGQCKNPYDTTRNPCGSSAGSGVSVAAGMTVLAIGTETNGSIVCPSNNNGIVGIKPTVGLLSRTGIVPISETQDTPGPMARSVSDAAIALSFMAAKDSLDAYTLAEEHPDNEDYSRFLNAQSLKGKRIGYLKSSEGQNFRVDSVMDAALNAMREAGAEIVEVDNIGSDEGENASFQVLLYEFKDGLNKYLSTCSENIAKDLGEVIEKTKTFASETRYFDHALLEMANAKGDLTEKAYLDAKKTMLKAFRENGMDAIMNSLNLDAVVAPTGGTAWKTDMINGDKYGVHSSSPAAISGYPSVSLPMGFIDHMPLNISFFGKAYSEAELIALAYAFEQKTKHRRAPKL